ncbi:MAG: flagellar biosynthesis protein FlhA [Fibrobacteria bacterium]|nr:flagellar biosynthesis protein FlhA [Fibrobacteria bacterium]
MAKLRLSKLVSTNRDLPITILVVGVIVMMMIPLPSFLLDIFLAAMISLALVILMVSMYIKSILDFSVFPGMLLVITLFRLSLNVASTRLILSSGSAGNVIEAFGTFVTAGNIVVGVIVFIILVVIQFVVITKGAGRIAEVAARFTLDSMPGKQMAVDADLNSGLIDEQEAKERRSDISREADFYGAMDGASKFVRGDAVAGIVITLINIVGGFIVGMVMLDLSFVEALTRFTRLTIGDGLVTQTPALMISTASGLMVSRAASKANLGTDIVGQLTQNVKALYIGAVVMAILGIIPGMPTIPFLVLAVGVAGLAFFTTRKTKEDNKAQQAEQKQQAAQGEEDEDKIENYLQVDQMELEIGYALIPLVDANQGGDLLERITMLRRQVAGEMGIVVPPIRIRDNIQLKPSEYGIKIKGIDVGRGELMTGCYLAMDPGGVSQKISGVDTVEPAFGLPAIWITESQKEAAEIAGYTVVELPAVLATHLTEIIKNNSQDILTREDVKGLLEHLKSTNGTVVEELSPALLSVGEVQKILKNLLSEKIAIRDLGTVLEAMADAARVLKAEHYITEQCRTALARQICRNLKDMEGKISVITLEPKLEQILEASVQSTERGPRLVIRPDMVGALIQKLTPMIETMVASNLQPALICSPNIRYPLRKLLEGPFSNVHILAYNEIIPGINLKTIGTVVIHENENISS